MGFDPKLLPDYLPIYYSKFFPCNIFCRWLSCGCSPHPLCNREISFTLAEDVYIRYITVSSQKELQALFQKKCPHKIDIGAVYNTRPSIAKQGSVVMCRELVFDIDMTDYDDTRTCCQGADVCDKCWKLMVIASQILDAALKEDFGFSSVVWVYSGRRGIHCWVSSNEARSLSSSGRAAVADYLAVLSGGDSQHKKVHINSDTMHTSIKRAWKMISVVFDDILNDQQFLSTPERVSSFLKLIPDDALATQVGKAMETLPADSQVRWKTFLQIYNSYWKEHTSSRRLKYLVEEIQLQWCYPRLDINVTKGSNHLLKAPFSIHPKTGKVCVVFRTSQAHKLRPQEVPGLADLLDEQSPKHSEAKALMQEAVAVFQDHVFSLEKEEAKRRKVEAEGSIEF